MKKIIFVSIVGACLAGWIISCKREISLPPGAADVNISKVNAWLDQQEKGKLSFRADNIELLKKNMDLSTLRVERSENGEQLFIISVKQDFKSVTDIDKNSIPYLFLATNKSGEIRNGNLVLYTPDDGNSRMPDNTFYNIFNTGQPECNGKVQFLGVGGGPQYQLQYKDKHLVSSGLYQAKKSPGSAGRTSSLPCYDYYLVTTWYDIAGNVVDQTRVYLYTICGDCGSPKLMSLCSGNAGDGGEVTSDCCITDQGAQLSFRQIGDPGSGNCGPETIDPVTGQHTKTCIRSWYFITLNISFYSWKYGSIEQATEVKNGTLWNFKSVVHQGGMSSGTVPPCMSCTCGIGSAVPFFSGNVARMDIIYTLSFSYPCAVRGGMQYKTDHASTQWTAG